MPADRAHAARAMDHHGVRGRPPPRSDRRAARHRRADQRHDFPRLDRVVPRADAEARRHRRSRQPRQPQGRGGPARHPSGRGTPAFLPRYSPDLNPIEQVFAKLKTLLGKADERSITFHTRTSTNRLAGTGEAGSSTEQSVRASAVTASPAAGLASRRQSEYELGATTVNPHQHGWPR